MIKFQHTIFALPFAFTGMLMAAGGFPDLSLVIWIVIACVFARTAAMSFNRWADRELDRRNPRTANRALPARQLSEKFVVLVILGSICAFVVSAAMLNWLAFVLSPVALLILLGYSYTKRFTSLAHVVLGLALALAPIGAWIAVTGKIGLPAVLLGLGVMLWTTGFDLIYACQDVEVDRTEGLFSIPSRYGVLPAITMSRALHVLCIGCFLLTGTSAHLGIAYYTGIGVAALLLMAEQMVVDTGNPDRINLAFFTINSWVGMAVLAGTAVDILVMN